MWEYILTLMWLGDAGFEANGERLWLDCPESDGLATLGHWLQRETIDASLARRIRGELAERNARDEWPTQAAWRLERARDLVDGCYTRDARGNGRLVLSEQTQANVGVILRESYQTESRSRLWNLASIFYNDRKTVEFKLDHLQERVMTASTLPYPQAVQLFKDLERDPYRFNACDGMFLNVAFNYSEALRDCHRHYYLFTRLRAQREALRIMAALNQYRAARGHDPSKLEELAPEFIDRLPLDPFSDRSFVYRPDAEGDYLLYAFGGDGDDDGGCREQVADWPSIQEYDGDEIFTRPRPPFDSFEPRFRPQGPP